MALKAVYERFLAAPSLDALSPDASWHYITTTTSVTGGEKVLKHLNNQQKEVKKKGNKTLSAIETPDALVLDVETTLEFVTGGGAYLPSLDDNFLADRVVVFPTVHIVRFNAQKKIQHVKIYWDQGSLLKQVEVIGSRGRNWPIRDGNDQSKFVSNVATAQGTVTPPSSSREDAPTASGKAPAPYAPGSARPPSRDPSEIFGGGEPESESTPRPRDSIISPRAGAERHFQPVRVFGEDGGDEPVSSPVKPKIGSNKGFQPVRVFDHDDDQETASGGVQKPRAGSSKGFHAVRVFDQDDGQDAAPRSVQQPRAGSTKNFHAVRVFDQDDSAPAEKEVRYKTHPNKFSHFSLGDEGDPSREIQERPAVRSRPLSQWDFEDFTTPEKPRRKLHAQEVRHFGWSDNEDESTETPPVRHRVIQPRRDAQTHFDLEDDATADAPAPAPGRRTIGSFHNKGLRLYENNLYDEEGHPTPYEDENNSKHPLGPVPNNAHRKKDFDAHWEVHDPLPGEQQAQRQQQSSENIRPVSSDRMKAVQMMTSSWDTYDQSPESKEARKPAPTTKTTLPNRASRAMFQPTWSLGDEE